MEFITRFTQPAADLKTPPPRTRIFLQKKNNLKESSSTNTDSTEISKGFCLYENRHVLQVKTMHCASE